MHTHMYRHTWDFHFAGGGGLKEMARWKKRNTKPGAKRPMEKMAAHCLEKRALKEKTEPSGEVGVRHRHTHVLSIIVSDSKS